MIVDERMVTYIHSLESSESEIIEAINTHVLRKPVKQRVGQNVNV